MKKDIADTIADCLVQDHICLMKENVGLRTQLSTAQAEIAELKVAKVWAAEKALDEVVAIDSWKDDANDIR